MCYSVFSHGQFYVGVYRGTNWGRVHVFLKEGKKTTNIVYKEVLLCWWLKATTALGQQANYFNVAACVHSNTWLLLRIEVLARVSYGRTPWQGIPRF